MPTFKVLTRGKVFRLGFTELPTMSLSTRSKNAPAGKFFPLTSISFSLTQSPRGFDLPPEPIIKVFEFPLNRDRVNKESGNRAECRRSPSGRGCRRKIADQRHPTHTKCRARSAPNRGRY